MVMGLFFAINGLRQAIIQPNLARMAEYIRLGTLDFLLTKPISSQFMVSFRHVGIYNWLDPILGLGLVAFGLIRRGQPVTCGRGGRVSWCSASPGWRSCMPWPWQCNAWRSGRSVQRASMI